MLSRTFLISLPLSLSLLCGEASAQPVVEERDVIAANMFVPRDGSRLEVRELNRRCTLKGIVVAPEGDRPVAYFDREICSVTYGRFTERPAYFRVVLPAAPQGYYPAGQRLRLASYEPR